ncbi:Gfo/Idh/MocA family protein [Prosthecomicrobium sp. N25]|uniref:Gfo/Idh/MocA family protein n=1 Tax=Prosthecomicrobium sp. N25 TaxID=3129254 RepID=UPI0030785154
MSGDRIRAAVIGAGWWGAASHLPTLASRPEVILDGVCRLGTEELERVRAHFGVAFASEDHRDVLARRPDVVVVASPHHLHFRQAADALEAGAHVLVEKPMTLDPAEAWALVRLAEARGRHLLVCNPYQYLPVLDEIGTLLQDGRAVGRIESVACSFVSVTRSVFTGAEGLSKWKSTFFRPDRATWQDPRQGGGFAYGQMSHAIPLALWLTGLVPRTVRAATVDAEGVDLCNAATVLFEGGAIGTFHGAAAMPEGHRVLMRLTVSGTDGVAILDIDRDRAEIRRGDGGSRVFAVPEGTWIPESRTPTDALVDLALGRGENRSPGRIGAAAVGTIAAMLDAARGGEGRVHRPEAGP